MDKVEITRGITKVELTEGEAHILAIVRSQSEAIDQLTTLVEKVIDMVEDETHEEG